MPDRTEFEILKEECAFLVKEVKEKWKDFCVDLIFKDIHILENDFSGRLSQNAQKDYVLDGKITLKVIDGNLEIVDRRETSYLWIFEIEKEGCTTGDWFIYNGRPYSVSRINESTIKDSVAEAKKVIQGLKATKTFLDSKPVIEQVNYSYICSKTDRNYEDINAVIRSVLEREWI